MTIDTPTATELAENGLVNFTPRVIAANHKLYGELDPAVSKGYNGLKTCIEGRGTLIIGEIDMPKSVVIASRLDGEVIPVKTLEASIGDAIPTHTQVDEATFEDLLLRFEQVYISFMR